MQITILCSDTQHPIYPLLVAWQSGRSDSISIVHRVEDVASGHILFLIACQQIVPDEVRSRFKHTLIIHASDLPKGRGWSPLVHELLAGRNRICVTLLEAEDAVDSGDIWKKEWIEFRGNEVHAEIHGALSRTMIGLMDWAVQEANGEPRPVAQSGEPTYYERRKPTDSEVRASAKLEEIFDLLRLADHERYPVYFTHRNRKFRLKLEPFDD